MKTDIISVSFYFYRLCSNVHQIRAYGHTSAGEGFVNVHVYIHSFQSLILSIGFVEKYKLLGVLRFLKMKFTATKYCKRYLRRKMQCFALLSFSLFFLILKRLSDS